MGITTRFSQLLAWSYVLMLVIRGFCGMSVGLAQNGSIMKAPEFVLQNQYQQTHHYRFPRDKISFLVLADYHGSEQLEGWIRPLYQRYEKRIEIDGVAIVDIVPAGLRGMVRGFFKKRLTYPVMLDWQGVVSRSYAYQPRVANLFLIDRQGNIRFKMLGASSEEALQEVITSLDRLLEEGD